MPRSLPQYTRLAGWGILALAPVAAAGYALLAWETRYTPQGGIDRTQSLVTMISMAVPFAVIIAAVIVSARQLIRGSSRS
jgi:hypothetical protein